MKPALFSMALAGVVSLAALSEAAAWTRNGTVTTARGTYTHGVTGGCYGGACSRSSTWTGPNGHTVTRNGSVTRVGPYRYAYSRTTTGPYGGSVTRSGWYWRRPYRW